MASAPTTDRARRIAAVGYEPPGVEHERVGACNLCGETRQIEAARRDRYGYPTRLVVCPTCGLGYLSPRPTQEAYATFYAGVYRPLVSAYHGRLIDADTVQDDQRAYADELRAFLEAALTTAPSSLLDIGGSTGLVARVVGTAFGARSTVLDPAPDELAHADAAGLETITGFAEDLRVGDRRWDLILLCQTADHVLDLAATLDGIRNGLAAGGHAFVDVLDVGWMLARAGRIEDAVKIDHPYYLTRATALGFFARAGLAVAAERMSHDGHWGFLLEPAPPRAPDLGGLRAAGERFVADVWRRRAETGA